MPADDHTVSAAVGALEPRALAGHELGELAGKVFESGWRREADLGVNRERQQPGALLMRPGLHAADVADDGGGGVNQMFRGKTILHGVRRFGRRGRGRRRSRHHRGIDDEGARAGNENALDASPALLRVDELDQAGSLEGTQVVIDALTTERELGRELGG